MRGLNGQWLGRYSGSGSGKIALNIDERQQHYEGQAYLHDDDKTIPSSVALFRTPNKESRFSFRTNGIFGIDPGSGQAVPFDTIKQHYPSGVTFSRHADITGRWDDDALTLEWKTDTGVDGMCLLPRSKAGDPSELVPLCMSWKEFKDHVSGLQGSRHLFRGQSQQWRLRTKYHRTGRADLVRFVSEDFQVLHKHLSARTKHVFNLSIPDEYGAFLNLIQHHGYPTPLLDWTYSPYVAAFFAYRRLPTGEDAAPDGKVRIHVFDQARWRTDWAQVLFLVSPALHVSIGEFIAIENERLVPQQAATTVTNIDDIETYILSKESVEKRYLSAIDLPGTERGNVIRDLNYMGITAGSLFPGLDGACEELAQRNFAI